MFSEILYWTDSETRLKIGREYGITSQEGIRKHLFWNSERKNRVKKPNWDLIKRLTEAAEHNRQLASRAKQLNNL